MFEQATLSNGPASKRVWSAFAGVTGQAALITGVIVGPMLFPQVLPRVALTVPSVFAPIHRDSAEPKSGVVRVAPVRSPSLRPAVFYEPQRIPQKTELVDDVTADLTLVGVPRTAGGGGDGSSTGPFMGLPTSGTPSAPPPVHIVEPPVQQQPPAPITRVVQGGLVRQASIVRRVEPVYPTIAKQAHISGTVELEGVIGVDGRMIELRVKSGHPLLVKAAYEAVIQWTYQPTTLNGKPVEVIAPITVTFHLN